jgi:hypothetical protein
VLDEPLQPPAKQAIEESALRQQCFQVDMAVLPCLRLSPQLEDIEQDDEIEEPDQEQEGAGHAGADDAAEVLERGQCVLDGRCDEDDADGKGEHDRRMTQRKEEADAQRPLALLQHEPHRVVDRRDVIGVEGVPQPEHVGDEAEPDQCRKACGVVKVESPAHCVQQGDDAVERRQPAPFRGRERRRVPAHVAQVRARRARARYSMGLDRVRYAASLSRSAECQVRRHGVELAGDVDLVLGAEHRSVREHAIPARIAHRDRSAVAARIARRRQFADVPAVHQDGLAAPGERPPDRRT